MTRELAPDARELLDDIAAQGLPPASAVTPTTARELLDELLANRGAPVELDTVRDIAIPGADQPLDCWLYYPDAADSLPALVYYHGGGWV